MTRDCAAAGRWSTARAGSASAAWAPRTRHIPAMTWKRRSRTSQRRKAHRSGRCACLLVESHPGIDVPAPTASAHLMHLPQ